MKKARLTSRLVGDYSGNAYLELLLCLPSALLLLFVSVDLGLAWVEQAALNSSLRSSLREVEQLSEFGAGGGLRPPLQQQGENLYAHLSSRIRSAKASVVGNSAENIEILVQIVEVSTAPDSGAINPASAKLLFSQGEERLSRLASELQRYSALATNPVSPQIAADGTLSISPRASATLVYLLVRSESGGIASSFIRREFGKGFSAEESIVFQIEETHGHY